MSRPRPRCLLLPALLALAACASPPVAPPTSITPQSRTQRAADAHLPASLPSKPVLRLQGGAAPLVRISEARRRNKGVVAPPDGALQAVSNYRLAFNLFLWWALNGALSYSAVHKSALRLTPCLTMPDHALAPCLVSAQLSSISRIRSASIAGTTRGRSRRLISPSAQRACCRCGCRYLGSGRRTGACAGRPCVSVRRSPAPT